MALSEKLTVHYHREMKQNYLMIAADEEAEQSFEARMLSKNTIDGLLRFRISRVDDCRWFCYEITSRQPLARLLERKSIDAVRMRRLLWGIAQTLSKMGDYLLTEEQLLLDPEYIYADPEEFIPGLCLLPGRKSDFPREFSDLLQFLLGKTDHQDREAVVLIYGLYQESLKENYGLDNLMKWLLKEKQEEASAEGAEEGPEYGEGMGYDERMEYGRLPEPKEGAERGGWKSAGGAENGRGRKPAEEAEYGSGWKSTEGTERGGGWKSVGRTGRGRGRKPMEGAERGGWKPEEGAERGGWKPAGRAENGSGRKPAEGAERGRSRKQMEGLESGRGRKPADGTGYGRDYESGGGTEYGNGRRSSDKAEHKKGRRPNDRTEYGRNRGPGGETEYGENRVPASGRGSHGEEGSGEEEREPAGIRSFIRRLAVLLLLPVLAAAGLWLWGGMEAVRTYGLTGIGAAAAAAVLGGTGLFIVYRGRDAENADVLGDEKRNFREESWEMVFAEELPPEEPPEKMSDPPLTVQEPFPEDSHTRLLWSKPDQEDLRRLAAEDGQSEDIRISYYPFLIGKQENLADYILERDTVSRLHARIDRRDGAYWLTDLNSTNGTSVNGRALEANETVKIETGDRVGIADIPFCFR